MAQHDVIVVGAGPAGLSAGAALSSTLDCLVLDQGRDHTRRDRNDPREILGGIGGAGLFSDGKHSFWPAATALWQLPDPERLGAAFAATAALLARHGVVAEPWRRDPPAPGRPGAWSFKRYPSIYMPLAARMDTIAELASACAALSPATRVLAARREGDEILLEVDRDGARRTLSTRALVLATGRLSPRWIVPWLAPLSARATFRRLEFGLRIESLRDAPLFRRLVGVDPKLRLLDPDGTTEVRTFCVCRDGEVVTGETHGVVARSGRADGPPSGRSNLGLLVRTTDRALADSVAARLFTAPARSLPLAALDLAALAPSFGDAGAAAVLHAVERLAAWSPGLLADRSAVAHTPCIEGVGDYPDDDGALKIAPGVWVAGDACGRFRGIVASMISGRYVAASVARELR
ncbi:MAG: FAD-dependent monooxygenase [Myxococcales bacterium]|nr:FAD-dependent monooxygenase [Myxococcales bacterium]